MAPALRNGITGGINRLFFYVSRFRDAIEADLAFRGISLSSLWKARQWRKLLNLIQSLPPNSLFNEALTNDRETMMMMHKIQESRRNSDGGEDKPVGPRVSQVSEEARRLGEVASLIRWLGGVVVTASPKFKGGKIPKVEPYTRPVMIDGATGDWIGKPSVDQRKAAHLRRVELVKAAAVRHKKARQEAEGRG